MGFTGPDGALQIPGVTSRRWRNVASTSLQIVGLPELQLVRARPAGGET